MVELLGVSVAARHREYIAVGSRKEHVLEPNRKLSSLKALDNAPRAQSDMVAYSWKLEFRAELFCWPRPLIDKADKVEEPQDGRSLNVYSLYFHANHASTTQMCIIAFSMTCQNLGTSQIL